MANILITGGAGFIGSHLASRCRAEGDEVHVLVRPRSLAAPFPADSGVSVHQVGLEDEPALRRCFEVARPDIVYHLGVRSRRSGDAALGDALDSVNQDLVHLLTLLSVAARAPHRPKSFIRTGSLAEYGNGAAPYDEDQRELPINAYAAALVAGTHYARMVRPRLPFPVTTARLALTYGPRQSLDFLVPSLIASCLRGQPLLVRRPDDRRDLIHVDDVVDALRRLAMAELDTDVVNISTGVAPAVRDIAAMILDMSGADSSLLSFGTEGGTRGGIVNFCGSPERARRNLGWQATTSLEQGLRQTMAWHRGLLKGMKDKLQ